MSSPFIRAALEQRAEVRTEYEDVLNAAYARAEMDCNSHLLNRRGKAASIDPFSLFTHNSVYARAYASPELLEHWDRHPRPTFASYERQRFHERENEWEEDAA